MEISCLVTAMELKEINVATTDNRQTISIAKDLPPISRTEIVTLLYEYRDVFAWSQGYMKGLDPKFYQHEINLATDGGTE